MKAPVQGEERGQDSVLNFRESDMTFCWVLKFSTCCIIMLQKTTKTILLDQVVDLFVFTYFLSHFVGYGQAYKICFWQDLKKPKNFFGMCTSPTPHQFPALHRSAGTMFQHCAECWNMKSEHFSQHQVSLCLFNVLHNGRKYQFNNFLLVNKSERFG